MSAARFSATPLPIIAEVSRLVTKLTDRLSGDRSEFPLFVSLLTQEALIRYGIQSNIIYGAAAWIELLEDGRMTWAGCWGENHHFWLVTETGELVDLNTAVSHRKRAHHDPDHRPKFSPPLLWSRDIPAFYQYESEGIAEIELEAERDIRWFKQACSELESKLRPLDSLLSLSDEELDFPDEAILCPGKRLLDDAAQSFRHFDRALMIYGIPPGPLTQKN